MLDGIDAASEITGNIGTLAENFEDLEVYEEWSSNLSKFGAAMGMLGVGLSVASMFMGEKSTEDRILGQLEELNKKLDSLDKKIDEKFADLADEIQIQSAKNALAGYVTTIGSAFDKINHLRIAVTNNRGIPGARHDLLNVDPRELDEAAFALVEIAREHNNGLDQQFLTPIIAMSHGDIRQVNMVCSKLMAYVMRAMTAEVAIKQLRYHYHLDGKPRSGDRDYDPNYRLTEDPDHFENIKRRYDTYFTRINVVWKGHLTRLQRASVFTAYLKDKIDDMYKSPPIRFSDRTAMAQYMAAELASQFSFKDFAVIVYPAVKGWENHIMRGSDYLTYFRKKTSLHANQKANFVVVFRKREREPVNLQHYLKRRKKPREPSYIRYKKYTGPFEEMGYHRKYRRGFWEKNPGWSFKFYYYKFSSKVAKTLSDGLENDPSFYWWSKSRKNVSVAQSRNLKMHAATSKRASAVVIW